MRKSERQNTGNCPSLLRKEFGPWGLSPRLARSGRMPQSSPVVGWPMLRGIDGWMDEMISEMSRDLFDRTRFVSDSIFANQLREPVARELRVEETDQAYLVELDLPGFRKDELRIDVHEHDGRIHLQVIAEKIAEKSAEKSAEKMAEEAVTLRRARVERRFLLPEDVEKAQIEAALQDGVLSLALPKKSPAVAEAQSWTVKVGDSVTGLLNRFKAQA